MVNTVEPHVRVIVAGGAARQYWRELWRYRELFYFLVWRDILVRYKQTAVGVAWAVLRPLLTLAVLTLVFGRFSKVPTGGVPTPLLIASGMLPWFFISTALSESGQSLITNANLISKVYFPRVIVPIATVIVSLVDLIVTGAIFVALMTVYKVVPPIQIVLMPLFAVLAFGVATGAGLWIAALSVRYRDLRFVIPFVLQLGFYLCPVGYATGLAVPSQFRLLYSLNPVVGVIDGFRWTMLGREHTLYVPGLLVSVLIVTAQLGVGIWYFRRTERSFADVI